MRVEQTLGYCQKYQWESVALSATVAIGRGSAKCSVSGRIVASILAARKLANYDGGKRIPATISAIADAVRWMIERRRFA
jgi:hypothetical protein